MAPTQNEIPTESEQADTLPASETRVEVATPVSDAAWDSEAPTAVHTRRPLFARPPRVPSP